MTFLMPSYVVADIRNLMQQHAPLFKLFEAAETMTAYITHNMDDSEKLRARLKLLKVELATT